MRSALGTGLRLAGRIGGMLVVALIGAAGGVALLVHEPSLAPALRAMAPAIFLTGCVWVLINASLAAKVTHANFFVRGLGEPMLLMAAGLLAALLGRTLIHLAIAHVVAAAATFTLALIVVSRVFGRGEIASAVRSPPLPGFARFTIPLGVAELMNAILQRADVVLLTAFVGPRATAVYAASEFLSRVAGNARYVFDGVAAPVFSEALHLGQRERLQQNLLLMTRWVATAASPISVTVVALRHDLLALYGPSFQAGAVAISVLTAGHLLNATLGLTGYIILVGGGSRLVLINNVVAAIVNVTLGLLLIPRLGIVGAAIAAILSVTTLQALYVAQVRMAHGVLPLSWSTLKPFAAAAIMLGVETLVTRHVATTGARIPLAIAAGLLAYLGALWGLGLQPEDRRLAASIWRRVTRR